MKEELRDRLRAMNPEPLSDPNAEELVTVFAAIDARRSTMTVGKASEPNSDAERGDRALGRPRFQPALAFAGMALLLIVVVGVGAVVFGGGDLPPTDASATGEVVATSANGGSTDGSVSTTATSSPATPASPVVVDAWQRVGADVMVDTVGLFDIAVFASGYAAVGWGVDDGPAIGTVFLSDDGSTWRQVAGDSTVLTSSTTLLYSIAEAGNGLIAAGIGCQSGEDPCVMSGAPWLSEGGVEWTRVPHDVAVFGDSATQTTGIEDILVTSDGTLVAVGAIDTWTFNEDPELETIKTSPAVWTSGDGVVWEKVWEGDGVELTRSVWDRVHTSPMLAVSQGPDGAFVAVGKTLSPQGIPTAAAWSSQDGVLWEPVVEVEATFGQNTTMTDVTWGTGGFVIVGTEGGHTPAIWKSTGPSDWTRISMALQPFDGIGSLSSIAPLSDGFVVAGPHPYLEKEGGSVTVWTSTDGRRWDRVHNAGSGTVATVLADGQRTMLAGSAATGGDWQGSVWVGPALDPTNPSPDPGPGSAEPTNSDNTDTAGGDTVPELTPVRWTIDLNISPGVHRIFTIVEARPLIADRLKDYSGMLVWDSTVVELCNLSIRYEGDDYLRIGDGFGTDEQGGCEGTDKAMQDAFDNYGLPKEACIAVITIEDHESEYCAPLKSD